MVIRRIFYLMNIREYIESGVLEEYCLGLLNADEQAAVLQICALFPEVKMELTVIEQAIATMAANRAITPSDDLKQKILNSLDFSDEAIQFDLTHLPVANSHSNHKSWLKLLEHLIPSEPAGDFSSRLLRQNEGFDQMLVVTKCDVPAETHGDVIESFFILKGECQCSVGDNLLLLGPGDFLEIPLHQQHDVKLLSPYVVAILQHQYL
jgi:mannose-6-phosphate isomerase-like protein (cupin superfamily)